MDQTLNHEASAPEDRYCDLVMKGGITSGVVYPPAIVKLAHRYRFKNIGGTSAGAIAAALTAAAEFRRRHAKFRERLDALFGELDILIAPCAPMSRLPLGEDHANARKAIL